MKKRHKCSVCSQTENLAQCAACKRLVCSKHRVGTGALSDGYTCTEHWGAGFVPNPPRAIPVMPQWLWGVLAAICIMFGFLLGELLKGPP